MPSFSSGEGSIYFSDLRCNGSENRLIDCQKTSFYEIYPYYFVPAGVRCQFNPSSGNVVLSFPFHKSLLFIRSLKLCSLH